MCWFSQTSNVLYVDPNPIGDNVDRNNKYNSVCKRYIAYVQQLIPLFYDNEHNAQITAHAENFI